jgi:hypothetical protein
VVRPTVSQLKEARRAYDAAVRALDAAMRRFDESDIPMNPGPDSEPYPWTAEHVQIMLDLHAALGEVINARRTWDRLRRSQGRRNRPAPGGPHQSPHRLD